MKTRIGTAMIGILAHYSAAAVMWGDCEMLDEAFASSSAAPKPYPPDRWKVVLNALDRDERFEKGYIQTDVVFVGRPRSRLVRMFKVKQVGT